MTKLWAMDVIFLVDYDIHLWLEMVHAEMQERQDMGLEWDYAGALCSGRTIAR